MRIRPGSLLSILALAALSAAFVDGPRVLGQSGDPRIDGVIPHVLPDADPGILGNPAPLNSGAARSNTPPASNASRPARGGGARGGGRGGRGNASAPASEAASGAAPAADTAPATTPEAAPAPATTGTAPAAPTESAPASPTPPPAPATPPAL